jgi:hypothetical protein
MSAEARTGWKKYSQQVRKEIFEDDILRGITRFRSLLRTIFQTSTNDMKEKTKKELKTQEEFNAEIGCRIL